MKKISILASALILFTTLLNADITIKNGWQLLGATQDMNTSIFNNTCVDYIWKYDSTDINNTQWKIHVANEVEYNHTITPITSLTKGEGYWLKGNGDCTVVNTSSGNVTYSPLKRWADNGDGTITDTTTGLIWYNNRHSLQGTFDSPAHSEINGGTNPDNPFSRASWLADGRYYLTDGSEEYDWHIPTMSEMLDLTSGVEAISPSTPYFFIGIRAVKYWTSTISTNPFPLSLMTVHMSDVNVTTDVEDARAIYDGMAVRNP